MRRFIPFLGVLLLNTSAVFAQGTLKEQKVAKPTRLDWEFAARGFGPGAAKLPADYDSAQQRYQLFVPKGYTKDKAWPLVLFISASEQPAGWKSWQKACEQHGVFFASPFGAGNTKALGKRVRVILDVLDDVRRLYRIDADQTYLTGFSGGGRTSCTIAFALPEYFGGVVPVCGINPIPGPNWQRQRIEERLSIGFITGEKDFNRKENEIFMQPWCEEIGIRSKLWIVPKMAHDIPGATVMSEVYDWLAQDLKRRRDEAKARPKLAITPDDAPLAAAQAKRWVESAADDLKTPARNWRGVCLLQGVTSRWPKTQAAAQANMLLKKIVNDEAVLKRVDEQAPKDEAKALMAQANALERFGDVMRAVETWELLAGRYMGTPFATKAAQNIKRLEQGK